MTPKPSKDKDVKPDLPVPPVFGQFSSDHVTQRSSKVDGADLDEAEAAEEAEKWAAYEELENARQEWDKQREKMNRRTLTAQGRRR